MTEDPTSIDISLGRFEPEMTMRKRSSTEVIRGT